jgi:acetyl esterase/lipase
LAVATCVLVLATLGGCTSLAFTAANVPAAFSDVERIAGVAYGQDPRQRLDVYRPPRGAGNARPVIVFFYGGAWDSGARGPYRFVGTALAELGFVTVVADYRLYPQVRFPEFIDDGARAVAWVAQHAAEFGADGQRIVLAGHSAGAHMAAMLALANEPLPRAGVVRERIVGLIGLSGPYDLKPDTAELNTIFARPYGPADWQVVARVASPVPPALLLHGADDKRVWPGASELLATRLREAGGRGTLRQYPRGDHSCPLAAFSLPARRRAPALDDIRAFLGELEPAE